MATRRRKRPAYIEEHGQGWRATVLVHGKRRKGATRAGEDAQQQAHQDALKLMRLAPRRGDAAGRTLSEALASILHDCERRECRPATSDWYRWHLAPALEHFGADRRLATISPEAVQRYLDARRNDGVGGQTIKHDLQALGRAFRIFGMDPAAAKSDEIVRPKVRRRDLSLRMSWTEVRMVLGKLKRAGANVEHDVLCFIAGTGIRRAEFARMRVRDFDLVGDRIVVPIAKTEPRALPLPKLKSAWTVVESIMHLSDGKDDSYLLPGATEKRRTWFLVKLLTQAREIAEQPRLQLHEMRRAFASRVAEQFPVPVVAALLGHSLPGMVGTYVQADATTLRAAMDSVWKDFE